ncbi:hypothetical protein [Halorussus sp. MSC15.2]|nr:hypothetical protein [Halorussus sp. MSC15.2]
MKLSITEIVTDPEELFDAVIAGIILMAAVVLAYLLLFGVF